MNYYNYEDAAKLLGVSRWSVRKYISELKLKLIKKSYRSDKVFACAIASHKPKGEWGRLIIASVITDAQIELIKNHMQQKSIGEKKREGAGAV